MSRSFATTNDAALINKNAKHFSVQGFCTNDLDIPYNITITYSYRTPKEIYTNSGTNLLPKNIIGEIPLVVLSPDNKRITSSSPDYRRQFINSILSQSNKIYLERLFEIRKILKQRNALLQQLNKENADINSSSFPILDQ